MVNLIILFTCAVLFFIFFAASKNNKRNTMLGFVFLGAFLSSLIFAVRNEAYHYGMHEEVSVKEYTLNEHTKLQKSLVKLTFGSQQKETVLAYPTSEGIQKTAAEAYVQNTIERTKEKSARLVQKTVYWDYNNKIIRFFFHFPFKEREIQKIENQFYLPQTWQVVEKQQKNIKKPAATTY